MRYPDTYAGPDQTSLTREEEITLEQVKLAKQNAIRMNEILTFIEHGPQTVNSEEYTVPIFTEPNRLFPTSDVLEDKIDHSFQAKNKHLPDISIKRDDKQGSHLDPRYKKDQSTANCDVMSNITNWSMTIRDAIIAIQRVLQVQTYENAKRETLRQICLQIC